MHAAIANLFFYLESDSTLQTVPRKTFNYGTYETDILWSPRGVPRKVTVGPEIYKECILH